MSTHQVNSGRRRLLWQGVAIAVGTLAGCGGSEDESLPVGGAPEAPTPTPTPTPSPTPSPTPTPPSPAPTPDAWAPSVPPLLVGTNATFDLSRTLPGNVAKGGTFGVDTIGAALPNGMSLSKAGLLAVGTAVTGTVAGVIFTYESP